jgi:SAM-dependent methyltransferase
MAPADWRAANRANWDERVQVHLGTSGYDLAPLRAGHGRLNAIEEAELGSVKGLRVLHLQCHFGRDTLTLAQRGAEVVGLDFSAPAVAKARELAAELSLESRARFVEADLYDAVAAVPEPHAFDLVFVTWGAITWLPDIRRWAEIVAHFLKPGGGLYLAEGHPAALVFDDSRRLADGNPGYFLPYFQSEPAGDRGSHRLCRPNSAAEEHPPIQLDAPSRQHRDGAPRCRVAAELAAGTRRRGLEDVRRAR